MSREKEDFRANIEQLNHIHPDHEMLTISEVMKIMGFRSRNTAIKYIPFSGPCKTVSKATLARIMCGNERTL